MSAHTALRHWVPKGFFATTDRVLTRREAACSRANILCARSVRAVLFPTTHPVLTRKQTVRASVLFPTTHPVLTRKHTVRALIVQRRQGGLQRGNNAVFTCDLRLPTRCDT